MRITCDQVFLVPPEPGKEKGSVAIRPKITDQRIEWNNTMRGVSYLIKSVHTEPSVSSEEDGKILLRKITFETEEGKILNLSLLNLDLYHQYLQKWSAGKPDFPSDDTLQKFYLETNFNLY